MSIEENPQAVDRDTRHSPESPSAISAQAIDQVVTRAARVRENLGLPPDASNEDVTIEQGKRLKRAFGSVVVSASAR